jgi:hypothetical protein
VGALRQKSLAGRCAFLDTELSGRRSLVLVKGGDLGVKNPFLASILFTIPFKLTS